jgi:hypothetical protein
VVTALLWAGVAACAVGAAVGVGVTLEAARRLARLVLR